MLMQLKCRSSKAKCFLGRRAGLGSGIGLHVLYKSSLFDNT